MPWLEGHRGFDLQDRRFYLNPDIFLRTDRHIKNASRRLAFFMQSYPLGCALAYTSLMRLCVRFVYTCVVEISE